jgi:glycosyltransferase involved in cell wall biosynthesis
MATPGTLLAQSADPVITPPSVAPGIVSVVIPVVERADDLMAVYHSFARQLEKRPEEFEFLFVFDGRFAPPAELVELTRENEALRILRFAREFGETAALRIGIEKSKGDLVLTLPAYFQVQPEGVGLLLDAVAAGADMAVANRSPRFDSWLNRVQSRAFHRIVGGVTDQQFHDMACGLRAMRRSVAESLPLYGDLHRFIPALALREGYRVDEVPLAQHPKDARTRMYRPGVYFRRLLDIAAFFFLAKFTERPLRFFGLVGSIFLVGGVGLSLILMVQRFEGQGIANRPMLLLAVLLVALGVQLIGLGLVGEIIVHLRAPHRRAYRVRERV